MNLGFLASGHGSNMQAVIDACKRGDSPPNRASSSATTVALARWPAPIGKATRTAIREHLSATQAALSTSTRRVLE
jgi:folate-dependent phosphoribosylglycinamide formyltransferase PurN